MALRKKIVCSVAALMLASGVGLSQRVDRQNGEAINGVDVSVDTKVRVRGIDAEPVDAPRSGSQSQPGQRAAQAISKWGPPRIVRAQPADNPQQPVSAFKGRAGKGSLISGATDASETAGQVVAARANTRQTSNGKASIASGSDGTRTSTVQQSPRPSVHNRAGLNRLRASGFPGTEKHVRLRARERSAQQKLPSKKVHSGPTKRGSGTTGSDHKATVLP